MKILIIEDEALAAEKLSQMIQRIKPSHKILDKIPSVEAATTWFAKHEDPDLIFLDIHLLDGTCFDILEKVKIHSPVIFTTAYDEYALEAFQLHSIDYLLKPISHNKLQQAFSKLLTLQQRLPFLSPTLDQVKSLIQTLPTQSQVFKSRFLIKSGRRIFSVSVDLVRYFVSDERITFLYTESGKRYPINYSLNELDEILDPKDFFRVNRQMIIQTEAGTHP